MQSIILERHKLWGSSICSTCSKWNVDFRSAVKSLEKFYSFLDNCIWIGCRQFSPLQRKYFSFPGNVLTNGLNPIQDGGGGGRGQKVRRYQSVATNVGFRAQNFLNFSFNPFTTLVLNFKFGPSASPKLLTLNQDHPSKKAIFLV